MLSLFDQPTADRICATPLYSSVTDDKRIWCGESNGDYSVKSAYRICVENLDTSHLQVNGSWNLLWSIKAPPNVKNLLWRICRNCVRTRVRLWTKGVECPSVCALCNVEE
jgi:hypothetical protein